MRQRSWWASPDLARCRSLCKRIAGTVRQIWPAKRGTARSAQLRSVQNRWCRCGATNLPFRAEADAAKATHGTSLRASAHRRLRHTCRTKADAAKAAQGTSQRATTHHRPREHSGAAVAGQTRCLELHCLACRGQRDTRRYKKAQLAHYTNQVRKRIPDPANNLGRVSAMARTRHGPCRQARKQRRISPANRQKKRPICAKGGVPRKQTGTGSGQGYGYRYSGQRSSRKLHRVTENQGYHHHTICPRRRGVVPLS